MARHEPGGTRSGWRFASKRGLRKQVTAGRFNFPGSM